MIAGSGHGRSQWKNTCADKGMGFRHPQQGHDTPGNKQVTDIKETGMHLQGNWTPKKTIMPSRPKGISQLIGTST